MIINNIITVIVVINDHKFDQIIQLKHIIITNNNNICIYIIITKNGILDNNYAICCCKRHNDLCN